MKHAEKNLVTVIMLTLLLTFCASAAEGLVKPLGKKHRSSENEEETASSLTIWQARKAVVTGLTGVMPKMEFVWGAGYKVEMHPETIRITAGSIDCSIDVVTWGFNTKPNPHTETCGINLKTISQLEAKRFRRQYELTRDKESGTAFTVMDKLAWETLEEAQAFADAVNRLRLAARGEDLELNEVAGPDFQQKAAAWRALPTKPPISEEVRKHRLLAEDSLKEKQFDAAVEEYEAGLAIDPLWPEGHFNAALLCAELGYYSAAIQHMHAYLELVPDANDAQGARDQITIWEAKAKQR